MKFFMLMFGNVLILFSFCDVKRGGSNEQVQKKIGEAFLLGFEKVKLYDDIGGNQISEIQNDEIKEVYYVFDIYEQKENWFKISAKTLENKDDISGWILNESLLGTYPRNYTDAMLVYLLPNKQNIVCSVDYFISPMEVIEFRENWVKVRFEDEDISCKEGWVMQDMTCSNPYTTCN